MRTYRNILFVNPTGDEEVAGFGLGIAYLSSVLRRLGKTVSLLDLVNIRIGDPKMKLEKSVHDFKPDIIGFSIHNRTFKSSKKLISFLRTIYSGGILIGGPEVTVRNGILEEIPEADIAVIGEAEDTLPELLRCMEESSDISNVDGIVWRQRGKIIANNPRKLKKDLDLIPFPDFEVYGIKFFDKYPIMTSRGCPFDCSFCSSTLGKIWRRRTPENVIDEIKIAIKKYKIKMIQFVDPAVNIMPERVIEICELMLREKIDVPWSAQGVRADLITDKLVMKMKAAGCKRLYVGIESLDPEVYAEIGKSETIEEIKQGIRIAKNHGLEVHGFLIIGLPKDNFKKTLKSFEAAERLNLDVLSWTSAVPYIGTRMHEWVKNNAREICDATKVSISGTSYEDIAFETKDFPYKERVLARKIIRVKSGSYHRNPHVGKLKYWREKLYLMLRYDRQFIYKRIIRSIRFRARIKMVNTLDAILQNESAFLTRIPDGTWGLNRNENLITNNELFRLNLNNLTLNKKNFG